MCGSKYFKNVLYKYHERVCNSYVVLNYAYKSFCVQESYIELHKGKKYKYMNITFLLILLNYL